MKQMEKMNWKSSSNSGMVYCLGFVGALFYFIQHSTSLVQGIVGFAKAVIWPAILVYRVLELFKL